MSNDLTHIVNFPTQIPDYDSHSLALLDLFISSDAGICSTMTLPPLRNWSCCYLSFHWLSVRLKRECPFSSHSLWLFSCWLEWSSWSLRDVSWEDIFKFGVSAAAAGAFCDGVQIGIDVLRPSSCLKQKSLSLLINLALGTFDELLIVFSTKVNLPYFRFSTVQICCLLHLIKQNCLLKTFLKTLTLMIQVALYLFSLLELIWNSIIFL